MPSEIGQKFLGRRFNENLDTTVAAKAAPRIERHHSWLAGMNDSPGAGRYLSFETTRTERSDRSSKFLSVIGQGAVPIES